MPGDMDCRSGVRAAGAVYGKVRRRPDAVGRRIAADEGAVPTGRAGEAEKEIGDERAPYGRSKPAASATIQSRGRREGGRDRWQVAPGRPARANIRERMPDQRWRCSDAWHRVK